MEGHRGGGAETLALDLGRADTHDADAFADALVGLVPAAVRLGRALGLSSDEAGDAVQEAVVLAWRHRDQLRGAIQPWFLAIVRRRAGRVLRWLTVPAFWSVTSKTGWPDPEGVDPDLAAALGGLPERQRGALLLRYGLDMSTADVARILGISEAATKQLYLRARVPALGFDQPAARPLRAPLPVVARGQPRGGRLRCRHGGGAARAADPALHRRAVRARPALVLRLLARGHVCDLDRGDPTDRRQRLAVERGRGGAGALLRAGGGRLVNRLGRRRRPGHRGRRAPPRAGGGQVPPTGSRRGPVYPPSASHGPEARGSPPFRRPASSAEITNLGGAPALTGG
jgi:DNA-directed RNA polymerase specialized sigma24 family protein